MISKSAIRVSKEAMSYVKFTHYIVRIGTNNFLSINEINEQNILFIIARYHKILSSCKFHKRWDFCLIAEKFIDCD